MPVLPGFLYNLPSLFPCFFRSFLPFFLPSFLSSFLPPFYPTYLTLFRYFFSFLTFHSVPPFSSFKPFPFVFCFFSSFFSFFPSFLPSSLPSFLFSLTNDNLPYFTIFLPSHLLSFTTLAFSQFLTAYLPSVLYNLTSFLPFLLPSFLHFDFFLLFSHWLSDSIRACLSVAALPFFEFTEIGISEHYCPWPPSLQPSHCPIMPLPTHIIAPAHLRYCPCPPTSD